MSTPPSEGVKDLLEAAGVGTFGGWTGWSLSIARMPDDPDTVIGIFDAPGSLAPEPKLAINRPAVECIVRGGQHAYSEAFAKAFEIRDALLGLPSQTVNDELWASITMSRDPHHAGWDQTNRPFFSLVFELIVHQGDLSNSHRISA